MTLLAAVLLLGAGGIFVARLLDTLGAGRAPSPVPQLAAFAPWAIPVWALLVVLGAATREGTLVLVAGAALVVQVIWLVPPGRRVAEGGLALTVVSVNALIGRADRQAVLDLVSRVDADVLVVQELTPELAADLDPAIRAAGLSAADLHPAPWGAGTGIWSRWPLAPLGLLPSTRCAMPQVLIQPPSAVAVTVTGVHTQSPDPRRIAAWRADLAMITRTVRRSAGASSGAGPLIFAGDFNASRDHAGFRQILTAGLTDAADVGRWRPGLTWPSHLLPWSGRRMLALTRLDHVLVSREIGVNSLETVSVPGSDHRAVVARLRLPVPAGPPGG